MKPNIRVLSFWILVAGLMTARVLLHDQISFERSPAPAGQVIGLAAAH